jgi:hypothetical protein
MKVAVPKANKSKTNLAGDRCTSDLYEARAAFVRAEAGRLYERRRFCVDYAARGILTGPVLDADWAPQEYKELPVLSVRTTQELAKFANLRFKLFPELDKSIWGIPLPTLSAKMVVGTSVVQASLTDDLRAQNRVIWDRCVLVLLLSQMQLETVSYQTNGKSVGCLG